MNVQGSWDNLREKLEKLPIQAKSFKKMEIHDLSPLDSNIPTSLPQYFAHLSQDEDIPDHEGEKFPDVLEEADFQEDNREGVDVLIYTRTKIGRPWLGRVLRKIDNTQFTIQWYDRRKGDENTFFALENPDGTPYTSDLDTGLVSSGTSVAGLMMQALLLIPFSWTERRSIVDMMHLIFNAFNLTLLISEKILESVISFICSGRCVAVYVFIEVVAVTTMVDVTISDTMVVLVYLMSHTLNKQNLLMKEKIREEFCH